MSKIQPRIFSHEEWLERVAKRRRGELPEPKAARLLPIDSNRKRIRTYVTMDPHAKGTFFCVQEAAPALRETQGCVITMASDAGLLGLRGGWAAYCAAMGAVVNLTRQLAIDLAPEIRVNGLAPSAVGTEHLYADLKGGVYGGLETAADPIKAVADSVPLKRIIEPGEIADAVLFLAGAKSMTGSILSIDAGSTIALQ